MILLKRNQHASGTILDMPNSVGSVWVSRYLTCAEPGIISSVGGSKTVLTTFFLGGGGGVT